MKKVFTLLGTTLLAQHALATGINGSLSTEKGIVPEAVIKIEALGVTTKADENGNFVLSNLPKGDLVLHVEANNFAPVSQVITIGDNTSELNIQLTPTSIEVISVSASPLHGNVLESSIPVSVLAGEALNRANQDTLGDTLATTVGVHSSYFGGVASTPVIRGLDGPRVMITSNGFDSGDVSRVGPDHVVATDTFNAQQIEIFRGPATLLYGSGAIGGVVNVVDNRIPRDSDFEVGFDLSHSTVNEANAFGGFVKGGNDDWAFYADASTRDADEYDIPGMAELHDDHEDHEDHDDHDEDHDDHDEGHDDHDDDHDSHGGEGSVENSQYENESFNVGLTRLFDNGFLGLSVSQVDRTYGIPGHDHGGHGHDEEHDDHDEYDEGHDEEHDDEHDDDHDDHEGHSEEDVFAKMEQERVQLIGEWQLNHSILSSVSTQFSYTDYMHSEIEGGEIGTTFTNETTEARVELMHKPIGGFKGGVIVHYKLSDFAAEGEEAFTPPAEQETFAVALLEETHTDNVLWQFGARLERVSIDAKPFTGFTDYSEDFTPISLSAGAVYDYAPGYNIGISTSYAERAPSMQELLSAGPHIATQTFEVGALYEVEEHDDHLDIEVASSRPELETSQNIDISWRKFEGDWGFVFNLFYNQIDDYYALNDTGLLFEFEHDHGDDHDDHGDDHEMEGHSEEAHDDDHSEDHDEEHGDDHSEAHGDEHGEEGLPVFAFAQRDATFYGVEFDGRWQYNDNVELGLRADWINAEYGNGDNIPRTPPARIGVSARYSDDNWTTGLDVLQVMKQSDIAAEETETDGYTLVSFDASLTQDISGTELTWYIKGRNLLDEEARVHTSITKNKAPLPGRDLQIGVRGRF